LYSSTLIGRGAGGHPVQVGAAVQVVDLVGDQAGQRVGATGAAATRTASGGTGPRAATLAPT
jgi:hypothetical protein